MRRQAATKQRRNLFERLRWPALIKRRDGWRCRVAGCATPRDRIEAHHLTPLAAGGASTLDNGVTLMLPQDDPAAALKRIAALDSTDDLIDRDIVSVDLRLGDRMFVRLSPEAAAKREADLKAQAKLAKRKGAST